MPETIHDLLNRLRRQDYSIVLTAEGKLSAKPLAGKLPDHIRSQLVVRRDEIIAYLENERFRGAVAAFRASVFHMVEQYEDRKPYTRCWAEGRALVDIWYGVMPTKEHYDSHDTDALLVAAEKLSNAVSVYFVDFDSKIDEASQDV